MHNAGFYHEDIKPYHFFIDDPKCSDDDVYKDPTCSSDWICIDLDRSGLGDTVPFRRRIINLYQMWRYMLMPIGCKKMELFIEAYTKYASAQLPPVPVLNQKVESYLKKRSKRALHKGAKLLP